MAASRHARWCEKFVVSSMGLKVFLHVRAERGGATVVTRQLKVPTGARASEVRRLAQQKAADLRYLDGGFTLEVADAQYGHEVELDNQTAIVDGLALVMQPVHEATRSLPKLAPPSAAADRAPAASPAEGGLPALGAGSTSRRRLTQGALRGDARAKGQARQEAGAESEHAGALSVPPAARSRRPSPRRRPSNERRRAPRSHGPLGRTALLARST